MKRWFLLLLFLPVVFAQPTDWFQSSLVKIELNVSSTIDLVPAGPNAFVESLRTSIIFVPQNSNFVAVREFETSPPAVVTGDRVRYEWKAPSIGTLPFSYSSLIDVANNAPRVSAKIPFPLETPKGFERYVRATKNIDSDNSEIIAQARLLAKGEDDLFVVVSKTAMWVKNNVNYNLSTLTADVSQPASWVLENRYGVCDELTSLFIAMLRALNIPARFISGLAFTDSPQFPQGWGAHGWAEVYFPGVGWVPFDPTFGEFGWVDPGHIKLKESLDPQEPTTVFEWKARDVDVKVHDLVLSADLLQTRTHVPFELRLAVSPLRPRVGFGSYNGIVLDVENLADYYVAFEFSLARVNDMEIIGSDSQQVVLPPRGIGRAFWKVKMRDNLDPAFQYEIPIQIYTIRNDTAKSIFVSGRWDVAFSEADVDSSIERLSVSPRELLDLACALESDMIWTDVGRIDCSVENKGDSEIPVTVCFKECRQLTLAPRQSLPVSFDVLADSPGSHEVLVSATSGVVVRKAVLTLVRLDNPSIVIKDVRAPDVVDYGESFQLSFALSRDSVSLPKNVTVYVKGGGAKAVVEVGELSVDQEVNINVHSEQLYSASPDFDIDVVYSDPFGRKYDSSGSVSVNVNGVPWFKRVVGWFIDLF